MIKKLQFIFIFQLITIISLSIAIMRHTDLEDVKERYNESYNRRQRELDPFCEADYSMKTAVCDAIFSYEDIQKEFRIYLNKNAIFHFWPQCEDHYVNVNPLEAKFQRMFPCYGRHNPILTGYGIDDHYKFIYISGGPDEDSIFIYHRQRTPDSEKYLVKEVISEIYLAELQSITFTRVEVNNESALQQFVAITNDVPVIEVNYIRNIIKGGYPYTPSPSVCNLLREQKLTVCKIVVEKIESLGYSHIQLLDHLFGSLSVKCEKKKIQFIHYVPEEEVYRDMFPCYGKSHDDAKITKLQLSDGYYENTVLAFMNIYNMDYFRASIHNINISNIPSADIPSSS